MLLVDLSGYFADSFANKYTCLLSLVKLDCITMISL